MSKAIVETRLRIFLMSFLLTSLIIDISGNRVTLVFVSNKLKNIHIFPISPLFTIHTDLVFVQKHGFTTQILFLFKIDVKLIKILRNKALIGHVYIFQRQMSINI
jgi:hypothetical protein